MYRFAFIVFVTVLTACSFGTAHQQFTSSMDTVVASGYTISELDYDPEYPHGYFAANSKYLEGKETLNNGDVKYNYKRPYLWEGRYCHYYLVARGPEQEIVSWGFNAEKSDPKKECGRSG
jgi:hypothetical protein